MASIKSYRLKNGAIRYESFVSAGRNPGTGRQNRIHKAGFKTHTEAEKWSKITEGSIASGSYIKENPDKMTIEQFLNVWIKHYKANVKEGTRIVHRRNIDTYIVPFIGKYQINKYKRVNHQQFINQLLNLEGRGKSKKGLSVATVKNINGTLSNAFEKAIQLDYIKENPTIHVEFPRETKKENLHYYTYEQSELFLEQAKKEFEILWYPFFVVIYDQGLRKSEVMGLQWQDIDFSNSTIDIVRQRLGAAEKKENVGKVITDDVKTSSSVRDMPMTKRTKNALLTFRNQILNIFGDFPTTDDNESFIFIQTRKANKGKVIRDRSVNGAATRIEKKAGLPHIKVHDGRHTFAVRSRQAGVSLEDIKDLLGHKDVSTSQIYAQISPEVKKRSMDQFEKYMDQEQKRRSK